MLKKVAQVDVYERSGWQAGFRWVAGIDEAGRGPLAGPVVAACVVLPRRRPKALAGLTDSKKLTAAQRETYFLALQVAAVAIGVGMASAQEVDQINVLQATFLAMRRAIAQVPRADYLMIDGPYPVPGVQIPQVAIVRGDGLSISIAAASVVAKVTRDRMMVAMDEAYPAYGFARHKGYGTAAHYAALRLHGPTPHHRESFLRSL